MCGSQYNAPIGGIVLEEGTRTDVKVGIEKEEDTSHGIFNNPWVR